MKKLIAVMLVFLIAVMLCGCGKTADTKTAPLDNSSDEYFEIENSDTAADSGETASDKSEQKSVGGNSGNSDANSGTADSGPVELYVSNDFFPKEVPSRKGAYKLTNTMNKLQKGETLNVVYYGGSVTGGTGSSSADKYSWRALTTAYLKSLTTGNVNAVNAALGGTGSYLGAARFEKSVLVKKPDLLFIEFAINDYYTDLSNEQCKMDIEYMISSLYSQNPYADIVIVLVTNQSLFGSAYPAHNAHREVADYYNIPIVDLGLELYNKLTGSSAEFKKLFSDSVHPNDSGYKVYGDIMTDALKELLVSGNSAAHKMPDSKLCENGFKKLKNHFASDMQTAGWSIKWWFDNKTYEKDGSQFRYSADLKKIYPKYLAPNDVGSAITVKFTGNSFGMLGTIKEGAELIFVVDGETTKTVKGIAKAELLEYPVFEGLSNSAHSVTVTVSGVNPYVAIAAFVTTSK